MTARRSRSTELLSMPVNVREITIVTVVTGRPARQVVTVSVSLHCWSARSGVGSSGNNSGSRPARGRSAVQAVALSPVVSGRPPVSNAETPRPREKASAGAANHAR